MHSSDLKNLKIAITGAGYAGAAAAKALSLLGAEVTVYERATEIREVGAGIGLRPSTMDRFRQWGIFDAIARVSQLLGGIAGAVRWGAAATLVTGFVVLIGTALAGARSRRYEAAILGALGASRAVILASFALRAAMLGLIAGLVALAAGVAGG